MRIFFLTRIQSYPFCLSFQPFWAKCKPLEKVLTVARIGELGPSLSELPSGWLTSAARSGIWWDFMLTFSFQAVISGGCQRCQVRLGHICLYAEQLVV